MKSRVSLYHTDKWAYCKKCGEWRHIVELKRDKQGAYRCIICGFRVRMKTRRSLKRINIEVKSTRRVS